MKTPRENHPDQLVSALAEIEDVIRTMPPREAFRHHSDEVLIWLGRATTAIRYLDAVKGVSFGDAVSNLHTGHQDSYESSVSIVVMLHQALSALRLQTVGPINIAIGQGLVFEFRRAAKADLASQVGYLFH